MKILRTITLVLLKTLLLFTVSLFIFSTILLSVIDKPQQLKTWLNDSDIYSAITDGFKNQLLQQNDNATESQKIVFDEAINKVLTPDVFRNFTETALDSTYAWLNGEVQAPEFNLDITKIKQNIANDISNQILKRLEDLPNCTINNPPITSDIFSINCIPPGTNIELEVSKIKDSILSDQSGEDFPLNAKSITLQTEQGEKPFYESLASVRDYFIWIKRLPIIAITIFLLLTGLIYLMSSPKIRALRTISLALIPNSILYIGAGIFLPNFLKASLNSALNQSGDDLSLNEPLQKITENLANFIGRQLIIIGVVLLIIGTIMFVIYRQKSKNAVTKIKPIDKNPPKPTNKNI